MRRTCLIFSVFLLFAFVPCCWAVCPDSPNDNGDCDTLNVFCLDGTQTGAGPYLVRFPFLISHDVPDPTIDSIGAFVIPLCFTHTNPTKYCSASAYLNNQNSYINPRSIFRHLVVSPTDTIYNWMKLLYDEENGEEWDTRILDLTGGTSHFWLLLIPTGPEDRKFGAGIRVLIATMTMRIQDTMHVSIDSCFWPPATRLSFQRSDGQIYIPRHNLPHSFWIGPPRIQVIAPNGGEHWAVGSTKNITWVAENFSGTTVKIDYSTNSGSSWLPVIGSTPNNGFYPWTIPNTPSTQCRVRVSDKGGDPYDISDADFWIIAPDFTIEVKPDTQTVPAGQSTNYNVILSSLNGFASPCTLTVSGLPTGASANFNTNPVTPTDTCVMNVCTNAGTTPLGTYRLIITAAQLSKALIQHRDTVFLIVTPPPDFTIDAKPDTQQVNAGNSVNYDVILTSLYGFANPCTLSVSGLPTGASAFLVPNPVTPTDTSVMTISTTGATPAGTYSITITGTEQAKGVKTQHSTQVVLIVRMRDFTIKAEPDTQTVRAGQSTNYNVILSSLNGFASPCTLTVGGLPTGASANFNTNPVTPTDTCVMNVCTNAGTTPLGTYQLIITAKQLSKVLIQHSDSVFLMVTFLRGDANADGVIDVGDVVYLINYLFKNGPAPNPLPAGDANRDGLVDVGDVVYLINYLFKSGPPPSC